ILTVLLVCALFAALLSGQDTSADEGGFALFFVADDLSAVQGGDAIVSEQARIDGAEAMAPEALCAALVEKLLQGPASDGMRSAIPGGTALLGVTLDERCATVDLSASYNRLSGVELSLADYCITLTLTQLPQVGSVRVYVSGNEISYRDRQTFFADEALLSATEDDVRRFSANLYFYDAAAGTLGAELRSITLQEGDRRLETLWNALAEGPRGETLTPLLPEGFEILSIRVEEDVCYINLPASAQPLMSPDIAQASMAMESLVRTICALDTVQSVQFLVDGEICESFAGVPVQIPVEPGTLYGK
ncbi:MAG: GerMN domain-containing protein, partial [Oscillospiraceae bacterium]|nr:GerMN domain-containing protein [Oscillospiraceae bacterium]